MALVNLAPKYSLEEINHLLKTHYGVSGELRSLPSERDQNWHVQLDDGREVVLKIANQSEDRAVLEMQHQAMALARGAEVPVQEVIPTLSGQEIDMTEEGYLFRMIQYLHGKPLALYRHHSPELLFELGEMVGRMDKALFAYEHPAALRDFHWDIQRAESVIEGHIDHIRVPEKRVIVENFLNQYKNLNVRKDLRTSVIHNDANDYNVLVERASLGEEYISGLLDFGDMLHSYTVADLAIACAYVMLDKADPLLAASSVIAGYHQTFPLTDAEFDALFILISIRLSTSVTLAAYQRSQDPDNEYLSITEKPAWNLLAKVAVIHPRFAAQYFRTVCGLEPTTRTLELINWLQENQKDFASIVEGDLAQDAIVLDLSVGSPLMSTPFEADDVPVFTQKIFAEMQSAGAMIGIGRYNEARLLNQDIAFQTSSGEQRTIHIGLDLFMQPGSPVYAPLDGVVHSAVDHSGDKDYGPTILLEHDADGVSFYTLYGHLGPLTDIEPGQKISKGQQIGTMGDYPQNGNWTPHLHFQIITDLLDYQDTYPGVVAASQRDAWLHLCPDPNLMLGIPAEVFPQKLSMSEISTMREQHLGPSLSVSYSKPLKIERGFMQYLYDENGRAYLDAVNNVPHVGHQNPHVVQAAQKQLAVLNTNTRYLHETLVRYAERLTAKLPDPLSVCFIVNSGSEANDLALRMASAYTGNTDMIVLDGAYHGTLSSVIDLSPYKFDGPGGKGKPDYVQVAMMPDPYRCDYGEDSAQYADHIKEAIDAIHQRGKGVKAFIAEPLLGCGGQVVLPENYFKEAFAHVREAGGVCIVDEVQVGFGRVGTHFWAFATQGVVPDIVTVGKPIGNGHPLAAVITTPEIAAAFNNGMEYFNTFGGNPVSVTIGMAVLDVIERDGLQENARVVGAYLKQGIEALQAKHSLIGDVRGMGLFIGAELVLDDDLTPAADHASYIANRMKEEGILISTDGPLHNVLKIKPPIVFSQENADMLLQKLEMILEEVNI